MIPDNMLSYTSINKKPVIIRQEGKKQFFYNFDCSQNIPEAISNKKLNNIESFIITKCQPSYLYIKNSNTKILVLNQYDINNKTDTEVFKDTEYLLLLNSPFINFNIIKKKLPKLKIVLFDNSNKKRYIRIWKSLCKRKNIKFLKITKGFSFD